MSITQEARGDISKKVAWISLVSNIVLAAAKILIGFFGDSEAVFADGIHSGGDVVASIAVLAVVGISNKPPDKEHPFGHGKAEILSEAIVGIILFLVSVYIVFEAISAFLGKPATPGFIAMFTALGSFFAKQVLYLYSIKKGQQLHSKAIMAIAYDHKGDIVASLAAFIGVLLAVIGKFTNHTFLLYGDAVASIIVAALIFRIAWKMLLSSGNVLMEKNVSPALLVKYRGIVEAFVEVKRIDQIRARDHGHYILLDVRVSMDHDLTIKQGHDIAHKIKIEIQHQHPDVEEVFIHINPYYE